MANNLVLSLLVIIKLFSISIGQVRVAKDQAQEPDDFNYVCKGNKFTGTWKVLNTNALWTLSYSEFILTLADESCNKTVVCSYSICRLENNTLEFVTDDNGGNYLAISIQSDFSNCGTTITEHGSLKIIKNRVLLQLTVHLRNGLSKRKTNYEGLINCAVPEVSELIQIGPSSSNDTYFNVVQDNGPPTISGKFDKLRNLKVASTIDFYKDEQFTTKHLEDHLVVRSNDHIYAKVQLNFNTKYFKFVVNKCFASTDGSQGTGSFEAFFSDKCSLDETFKILTDENAKDHFSFKIKTFRFIDESKSVYFHCQLYICLIDTNHPDCIQKCTTRRRRDVEVNDVATELRNSRDFDARQNISQKIVVTSKRIVFSEEGKTCETLSCPLFSTCHFLSPKAVCICDKGYIFSRVLKSCVKKKLAMIKNLQIDVIWKPEYANGSSKEFLKLARKYENLLFKPLIDGKAPKEIEGIKIINARQGITFDVLIIFVTSAEVAFKTFHDSIKHLKSTTNDLNVKDLNTLTLVFPYGKRSGNETDYRFPFTVVTAILVSISVVFVAGISLFHTYQRRKLRTTASRFVTFNDVHNEPC